MHGPSWVETSDEELRARLKPVLAGDGWVADGAYQHKLGDLMLDRADTIVWPRSPGACLATASHTSHVAASAWAQGAVERESGDGPDRVLGPRVAVRVGNPFAFRRRREWPSALTQRSGIRLTSPREVDAFLQAEQPA